MAKKKVDPTAKLLKEILDSAEAHGSESEAEHEVGDLQDALIAAWAVMTPAQRRQVHEECFRDNEKWEKP